uniref:Uncharacterized protein n=1 Tax=Steinernema glaseri TaxID=37863 RepID=A0A1I7YS57_9BILA
MPTFSRASHESWRMVTEFFINKRTPSRSWTEYLKVFTSVDMNLPQSGDMNRSSLKLRDHPSAFECHGNRDERRESP